MANYIYNDVLKSKRFVNCESVIKTGMKMCPINTSERGNNNNNNINNIYLKSSIQTSLIDYKKYNDIYN